MGQPLSLFPFYCRSFQSTNFCENVHLISSPSFRTHILRIMNLLPLPPGQGSKLLFSIIIYCQKAVNYQIYLICVEIYGQIGLVITNLKLMEKKVFQKWPLVSLSLYLFLKTLLSVNIFLLFLSLYLSVLLFPSLYFVGFCLWYLYYLLYSFSLSPLTSTLSLSLL